MNSYYKLILTAFCFFSFTTLLFAENNEDLSGFFPDVSGFTKNGEPAIYNPENLYDIINGAADVYLNYEFRELAVLTYENSEGQSFIIEIYRHEDADYGFGIYSNERVYGVSNYIEVGAQGYYEIGILNFVKGSYYVKMRAYNLENEEALLMDIARQIDSKLPGDNKFPEALDELPFANRSFNRERFVPKDFLGYSFFKMAYSANYYSVEAPMGYTCFIIHGESKEDCKNMIIAYRQSLKLPEEDIVEGTYMFEDPYYGTMGLIWEETRIKGMYGASDEAFINEQLNFNRDDYILNISESNVSYEKTASSSSNENARFLPEYAFDGDLLTRWSSEWSDPQWISVDLGDKYEIDKLKLYWEASYGKSYSIEISLDGNEWTEVYTNEEGDGDIDEIAIDPVMARYVRINGLVRASEYGYSLNEILIFRVE